MPWTYLCPHCGSMLNPREAIILVGERGDERYLVGFHPSPGNYEIYFPSTAEVVEGEEWSFSCPVCRHDLMTDFAEKLCAVDIVTEDEAHRVFFSRIAGDQATFVVNVEGLKVRHGRDVESYSSEMAQMKYLL